MKLKYKTDGQGIPTVIVRKVFTGKWDRNGEEIYDGDILNYDGTEVTVWFDNSSAAFLAGNDDWNTYLTKLHPEVSCTIVK